MVPYKTMIVNFRMCRLNYILFGFAALLLRRIKKEKRARRRLQEQMGGTQSEETKNIINDAASVTSQESDKHTPGEYNSRTASQSVISLQDRPSDHGAVLD